MQIIQKKRSNKHTFTFKDDVLNFAYEDKSGSGDSDYYYGDMPKKFHVRVEQNEWLRNVGYIWLILGAFQLGIAIYSGTSIAGKGIWLLLGAACLIWFYFSKVKYTVFQVQNGGIFVIQGNDHDKIVEEMMARRSKQLLSWYGDINLDADPEKEKSKFKWLHEEGVLTKEESEIKIAQVESAYHSAAIGEHRLN